MKGDRERLQAGMYNVTVALRWCVCKHEVIGMLGLKTKTELLWLSFGLQLGSRRWRGVRWHHTTPFHGNLGRGEWGVRLYGGRGRLCSPWNLQPLPSRLLFSTPFPTISAHPYHSQDPLVGWVSLVRGEFNATDVGVDEESPLAEFKILTVLDSNFNFHRSMFYRHPKIS